MGSSPHLLFCTCKTTTLAPELLISMCPRLHLYGSKTSSVYLCEQNSLLSTKVTIPYGSQTSPVDLCMQNRVLSTWITSLNGSQTSSVHLCKQNSVLSTKVTGLHVSQTSSVDLCMQNKVLSNIFSMGTRPHLWICANKTASLDQNYKSVWDPDLICGFIHTQQRGQHQNNNTLWVPDLNYRVLHTKQPT